MVSVTYVQADGTGQTVELAPGNSVMEGAVANGVAGIEADCGGACACGTCHVKIADEWLSRVEPADTIEEDMLEIATNVDARSRLSCQISVTEALDGLIVHIPGV